MSLKDLIFQKGGIGVSMSRSETVERFNPLIKRHMELNHYYTSAIRQLDDAEITARLSELQRTARMDVGKMMETVFSAGGTAYNGVELEPEAFSVDRDEDTMLFQLQELEENLQDALDDDLKLDHQIRSKAILEVVRTHSQERLNDLRGWTRGRRRPMPTQ